MIIIVGLFLLFISVLLEALIYVDSNIWTNRKLLSFIAAIFVVLSTIILLIDGDNGWLLLVGIISIYRLINLGRVHVNRLPNMHLKSIATRSFIVLSITQATVIILWQIIELISNKDVKAVDFVYIALIASFLASIVVLVTSIAKLLKSKPQKIVALNDNELPTLTVAIAARNESPNLTSCLESIISNDYPKLEILVLDDDSQDTTAEIIKSFAHDGVRFIKHQDPKGEWLAKNNAYQTLLQNSSGELIMYLGVDVRLHDGSLRGLVEQYLTSDVDMLTVFPKRTKSGMVAAFIQPMRYWWELALPKFVLKRPPAISTGWVVNSEKLKALGGFKTYKRSITPEEHLAKHFAATSSYSYTRTNNKMLVTTHKDFFRQWDTSVRTRYPHAHRRPENVLFQSVLFTSLILLPFLLLPFILFTNDLPQPYSSLIIISVTSYIISHILISSITNPAAGLLAPFNFPIAIILDMFAMHASMFKYEFDQVIWKGRDVAPVKLQTINHLPVLKELPKHQGSGRKH